MDTQRWSEFDNDLRIRIKESKKERYTNPQQIGKVDKNDDYIEVEYEQIAYELGATIK